MPIRSTPRLVLAACAVWTACMAGAQAQTLSFSPSGSQADGDALFDQVVAPGQAVTFNTLLDLAGVSRRLTVIEYELRFDPDELTFSFARVASNNFARNTATLVAPDTVRVRHNGRGGSFNDAFGFIATGPVNDGAPDVWLSVVQSNLGAGSFRTPTRVDVQSPVPEPGTLALAGLGLVGVALGRRRIKGRAA